MWCANDEFTLHRLTAVVPVREGDEAQLLKTHGAAVAPRRPHAFGNGGEIFSIDEVNDGDASSGGSVAELAGIVVVEGAAVVVVVVDAEIVVVVGAVVGAVVVVELGDVGVVVVDVDRSGATEEVSSSAFTGMASSLVDDDDPTALSSVVVDSAETAACEEHAAATPRAPSRRRTL